MTYHIKHWGRFPLEQSCEFGEVAPQFSKKAQNIMNDPNFEKKFAEVTKPMHTLKPVQSYGENAGVRNVMLVLQGKRIVGKQGLGSIVDQGY
jgi:hypothetical protein